MRTLLRHRVVVLLGLVLLAGLASFACGGGKEIDTEKLVPEGSSLIGSIQFEKILNDVDLESIYQALPVDGGDLQTIDQLLNEAMAQTGVDFRKISHATFFADVSRPGDFLGIIVRGSFDEDAVVAALQAAGEAPLTATDYKGRRVHSAEDDQDQGALVVLEGDNLVVGTLEAVRAVIDVQDGDRDRASGEVQAALSDLDDGLIRLVLEVPSGALQDQLPLGDIPFLGDSVENLPAVLGAVRDLALVGLSLDQDGQDLKLRVTLNFGSADSATVFGNFLDGILKLVSGASPDAQTRELVERLQIDVDGDGVAISLEIAVAELSQLFSDLVSVSSAEMSVVVPPAAPNLDPAYRIVTMPTANHVPDGDSVDYNTTPPTSGDHLAGWADCGFYPGGLPDELIVHNLEHSNIVVSYNLPADDDVARLRSAASWTVSAWRRIGA
jgi:hypothetical protein